MKRLISFVTAFLILVTLCCTAVFADTEAVPESEQWETRIQDLANSRIGVVTGGLQALMLPQILPEAEIMEFNLVTDAAMALNMGKIDAFSTEESVYLAMCREGQAYARIDEPFMVSEYGMVFYKNGNPELQAEFNKFLADSKADGTLTALQDKWFGETEVEEFLSLDDLTGENGVLTFATSSSQKPFSFMKNGVITGFDVELVILFAGEYGYDLEIADVTFSSILLGIEQGKYDIGSSGITITEERRKSMDFSDPYYVEDVVMVVSADFLNEEEAENFWTDLKVRFEKTLIRESRWKLIVRGIGNTVGISFFATVIGSVLGFVIYLLARSKNSVISGVTKGFARVYTRLIAGTPTLVVLLILYYIIFGKTDISGILIATLGFSITFGAFVYSHLALSVESLDRGQTEAAYALGYTRSQTFFRILLPQAMQNFLPTFTGEVIGMIKSTSVVGYIAVNDLTKMGDIIRSNTYEAMFPLLTVAVIYFFLTWGAAALLGLVQRKLDYKKRRNKKILKGVVR